MRAAAIKILGLAVGLAVLQVVPAMAGDPGQVPDWVIAQVKRTCVETNVPSGRLTSLGDVASLMKSPEVRVRAVSAYALGESRSRAAVQPLTAMLQDSDLHVRRIAASALGKIGDPGAADALIALLQKSDQVHLQMAVLESLGRIGGKQSLIVVTEYLNHDSPAVRHAAIEAKESLAPTQAPVASR
ncbi:MAG: HEAT repeat domain-containing protein [Deltaproteobacteria bacterium]|nr:HEAT repeat domain-containing protein [Deltaproteobacteria bacterium]